MSNQHSFDSRTIQTHEFDSTVKNTHSFFSIIRNSPYFESIISNFSVSTNWASKIISESRFEMASSIYSITKISAEFISISGATIDRLLISDNLLFNAEFHSNSEMSAIMAMLQNLGIVAFQSVSNFEIRLGDILKIDPTVLSESNSDFQASIVSQKYYLLSDWDASLLSDLDSMLLSDMDYQVV